MRNSQIRTTKSPIFPTSPVTTTAESPTISVGNVLSAREQFLAKLQARKATTPVYSVKEILTPPSKIVNTPSISETSTAGSISPSITTFFMVDFITTTITTSTTSVGSKLSERQQFLANLQAKKTTTPFEDSEPLKVPTINPLKPTTTAISSIWTSRKQITFPTFSTIVVQNDEDDPFIKNLICK